MANPLKAVSSGLKGLKDKDYSAQKEQLAKLAPLAKKSAIQLAVLATRVSATLSEIMRGAGAKLQEKVPQLGKLSDLLLFYAIYSIAIEVMNFVQFENYLGTLLLKIAPLLVFGLGAAATLVKSRLEGDDEAGGKGEKEEKK